MGENEAVETKSGAGSSPTQPIAKGAAEADPKAAKKKQKKAADKAQAMPHVTGKVTDLNVAASGITFKLKGKKGKAETYAIKGFEPSLAAAASAMLTAACSNGAKLRAEYTESPDGGRTVKQFSLLH
jgi:hypothetical protein